MRGWKSKFWGLLGIAALNVCITYLVIIWSSGYRGKLSDIDPRYIFTVRNTKEVENNAQRPTTHEKLRQTKPYETKVDFEWIKLHQVYSKFSIKEEQVKKRVNVVIIVSSAPSRVERRNGIRQTWWTQCKETKGIVPACIFMTDLLTSDDKHFHQVQNESSTHKDIRFQKVPSGVTFGLRFINHMVFSLSTYHFDYFVRLDDDQFLCLDKFLGEVPVPMLPRFHWGWVHNVNALQRPEESIILFSRDVIETFVMQDKDKMFCHPWADQMIGVWLTNLGITELLRHDHRIHHHPPVSKTPALKSKQDLCQTFMSLHGVYEDDMKILWKHRGTTEVIGNLNNNSFPITIVKPFNWQGFVDFWKYEPKLCICNPQWDTSKQLGGGSNSFLGRQSGRGMYK